MAGIPLTFTATASCQQLLCCNAEGWGPLSGVVSDFTPCFLDMLISLVAVFGAVFGAYCIWWVVTKKQKSEVALDRQFWAMLVSDSHVYLSSFYVQHTHFLTVSYLPIRRSSLLSSSQLFCR
jgi:hypothetical protein